MTVNKDQIEAHGLTPDEYKKCIEIGIDGCKQVYEIQKKSLQEKYFTGDNN